MLGKPLLELGHAGESTIPASLQLTSDEAVLGIGRVILSEGPISSVPRRLEITDQGIPRLVTSPQVVPPEQEPSDGYI